jgi:hypothetical protein
MPAIFCESLLVEVLVCCLKGMIFSSRKGYVMMDQDDVVPPNLPQLFEKFSWPAEPFLDHLGCKKGIFHIHLVH